MDEELIADIRRWCKEFESQMPSNVQIDDDTFEGGAYYIFQRILSE